MIESTARDGTPVIVLEKMTDGARLDLSSEWRDR
jgi:hypothetical protein